MRQKSIVRKSVGKSKYPFINLFAVVVQAIAVVICIADVDPPTQHTSDLRVLIVSGDHYLDHRIHGDSLVFNSCPKPEKVTGWYF